MCEFDGTFLIMNSPVAHTRGVAMSPASHVGQMFALHINRRHRESQRAISEATRVSIPASPPVLSGQLGRTQQQHILQWKQGRRVGETQRTHGGDYQLLSVV